MGVFRVMSLEWELGTSNFCVSLCYCVCLFDVITLQNLKMYHNFEGAVSVELRRLKVSMDEIEVSTILLF